MDLYSINYLHFGAPKQWYCIPPDYSERFERIAQGIFSQDFKQCPQFLRHKTHLISPSSLTNDGVPFNRLVQHEGEFVLTFPFAYHSGYNLGFNCAESINFALENWIDIGRKAESCRCITDSVQIDVEAIFRSSRDTAMDTDEDNTAPPRSRSRTKKEDVEMKEPESSTDTAESSPSKKRRRPGTGDDDISKTSSSDKHVETRSTSTTSSPAKVKSEAPVSKKSKVAPAAQEVRRNSDTRIYPYKSSVETVDLTFPQTFFFLEIVHFVPTAGFRQRDAFNGQGQVLPHDLCSVHPRNLHVRRG